MDFELSSEQEALTDSVRRFVEREYDAEKRKAVIRSASGHDPAHWATFAELGWLGAGLSEDAGGFGGSAVENALLAQELGRGLVTEPFVAHVLATQLLADIGGEMASGMVEAMVMGARRIVVTPSEPGARGDCHQIAATASESGPGWVINGSKSLVEGAPYADSLIVPAITPAGEAALFVVAATTPGVTLKTYRMIDNRRVADIELAGVAVGSEALLARGDAAMSALEQAVDHAMATMCGEALGIMDSALWATRDYLRTRKQFGVEIGSFQALQHRMADMLIEVELTRSALYRAIGALASDNPDVRGAGVSAAKVQLAKGGMLVGTQAIQLHGGIGMTEELVIGHYYRRLYVLARQLGDLDLHTARFAQATDRLMAAIPG